MFLQNVETYPVPQLTRCHLADKQLKFQLTAPLFPLLLLINNGRINQRSSWKYTWSSITTMGWLQKRELKQKSKKAFCKNQLAISTLQ